MIVKVQLSLASSDGARRVLIYNESRRFMYEGGFGDDIAEMMAGRPIAFFEAEMEADSLTIGAEVADPGW